MGRSSGAWRSTVHRGLVKVVLSGEIWVVTLGEIIPGSGDSKVMLAKDLLVPKPNCVTHRVTGESFRQDWVRTLGCAFSFFSPLSPFLCLILLPDPGQGDEWTEVICHGTESLSSHMLFLDNGELFLLPSFPPSQQIFIAYLQCAKHWKVHG